MSNKVIFSVLITALVVSLIFTFNIHKTEAITGRGRQGNWMRIFHRYSLGIIPAFHKYHPGVEFFIKNATAFNLTKAQLMQEKELRIKVVETTSKDLRIFNDAFNKYKIDIKAKKPSIHVLFSDINTISDIEANLAKEMVFYHLLGRQVLNPAQRLKLTRLLQKK